MVPVPPPRKNVIPPKPVVPKPSVPKKRPTGTAHKPVVSQKFVAPPVTPAPSSVPSSPVLSEKNVATVEDGSPVNNNMFDSFFDTEGVSPEEMMTAVKNEQEREQYIQSVRPSQPNVQENVTPLRVAETISPLDVWQEETAHVEESLLKNKKSHVRILSVVVLLFVGVAAGVIYVAVTQGGLNIF